MRQTFKRYSRHDYINHTEVDKMVKEKMEQERKQIEHDNLIEKSNKISRVHPELQKQIQSLKEIKSQKTIKSQRQVKSENDFCNGSYRKNKYFKEMQAFEPIIKCSKVQMVASTLKRGNRLENDTLYFAC